LTQLAAKLLISAVNWQVMLDHVRSCVPEEACGLLGGRMQDAARAEVVLPVANQLHSPVKFRMDPAGQLKALNILEESGFDLIAIFHSHPAGPEIPSLTDQAEFYYPGVLTLIFSPMEGSLDWRARAFHLTGSLPIEVSVEKLMA
jgi:proteasome lid subunit RPN8/RPN11